MAKYFFTVTPETTFKTEIADYIAIPGSLDIRYMKPAMLQAQRDHIENLIGADFYDELLNPTDPLTAKEIAAIEAIREPLAHLSVINALPHLNIKISQGGATQNNIQNETPAQWWQVRDQKRELVKNANNAMARLCEFLAKNAADYPTYEAGEAYKNNLRNFCNDFATANLILPKISSHYVFQQMRATMTRVDENIIFKTLGIQLYAHLKGLTIAGDDWGVYKPLLPLIQKAEVSLAFASAALESIISWTPEFGIHVQLISEVETGRKSDPTNIAEREQLVRAHESKGREAITALKNELTANADTYVEYVAPEIPVNKYVKTECKGGIYFGIGLNPE